MGLRTVRRKCLFSHTRESEYFRLDPSLGAFRARSRNRSDNRRPLWELDCIYIIDGALASDPHRGVPHRRVCKAGVTGFTCFTPVLILCHADIPVPALCCCFVLPSPRVLLPFLFPCLTFLLLLSPPPPYSTLNTFSASLLGA